MVTRRKRALSVPKGGHSEAPKPLEKPITQQVRDCWEFAALGQYLFIFGPALKIPDDWSIEILEQEILGAVPPKYIPLVKLALLRCVSSHKGLVEDQFDEYTRRQYLARKPFENPFGDGEKPMNFAELPVLLRIRVLYQLSQWSLIHPERLREKLEDLSEKEQLEWRFQPCGFDSAENTYFLLDDNRLYLRTPMIVPSTTKPVKSSKKSTPRPAKRRRLSTGRFQEAQNETPESQSDPEKIMLESMEWRCVCATLEDYYNLIDSLKKSKDTDEKLFYRHLMNDILPAIQAAEKEKKKAEAERQRKLALEAAVANRKRSSRIDAKLARQKEEEERAERECKLQEEHRAAREAAERSERIGRDRESRLAARERRMRGEIRTIQETDKESANESDATRHRISMRRRELEAKKLEEAKARALEEWVFDCICGVHGTNFDDGSPQVACDRCEVWQHVACLNLALGTQNKEFVCERCTRPNSLATTGERSPVSPRITIKLKVSQAQVHYEDAPIRVKAPDPVNEPNILPLSPRRSPNSPEKQQTKLNPPWLNPPNDLPTPQVHDPIATDDTNTHPASEPKLSPQIVNNAPPLSAAATPKSTTPESRGSQQVCSSKTFQPIAHVSRTPNPETNKTQLNGIQ